MQTSQRSRRPFGLFVAAALLAHLLLGWAAHQTIERFPRTHAKPSRHISLLITPPPKKTAKPEPKEKRLDGQLVDIAPPEIEEIPEEADFLAETNAQVEEETRVEEIRINPEVLSHVFSPEDKKEKSEQVDLNVTKPSDGSTAGNDRFDPTTDGRLASLPEKWQLSNKEGLNDPVPSSHASAQLSGAPNNDLIQRKRGESLNLNTKEFLYAAYLNRIRRLVNFYWDQNLDNVAGSTVLTRPRYVTTVQTTLSRSGSVVHIETIEQSGVSVLDDCVTRAFALAGPFSHPPEGLIDPDGYVRLPPMSFTVVLGRAKKQYRGVDPRAGVQFPGLLKSPR